MKNYIIVALPEYAVEEQIKEFRVRATGNTLVDSLPPHVTLKCRFALGQEFSEEELIDCVKGLHYGKLTVEFGIAKILGDALALMGSSDALRVAHMHALNTLGDRIVTRNPGWEGENYTIHMTLLRGVVPAGVELPKISQGVFDRIALYEIDPSPERSYAHLITVVDLA